MTIKDIKYLFILLAGCFFCCTETDDGCLDSTASNFDLTADDDCCLIEEECCCIYPDLKLDLSYKQRAADSLSVPATNFKLGTFYALENEQDSILIDTFELFLSQVKPINFTLADTICVLENIDYTQLNIEGESETFRVEDNIALIDGIQFSFDLGTYQSELDVEQLDYTLGLSTEVAQIDPENIITSNNLRNTYNFLFNELTGSFPSMRVKFTLKSADQQRVITRELSFEDRISFPLSTSIINDKGVDLSLAMRINVLDVFKGTIFDIANEDIDLIINTNLASSISIIE